ncbi:hypothetical protein BDN70DRAFT_929632 [Pholiota conissans]|uniref:F-box domain-containing protein n=1 Tax=Pholiota conissans TaxID=109636 RepID=A0A9P6CXI1_9AGAR|nr:hypothetical protein BDN70DRAFT_929632 [Pholiota conissans]
MALSLFELPLDLQNYILETLDVFSLVRCTRTCKTMYDIVKNSLLLNYTVQLHLDGFKDAGSTINMPYSDRLDHLLHRRRFWTSQHLSNPIAVHLEDGSWEVADGVIAGVDDLHQLKLVQFPPLYDAMGRTITRKLPGFPIERFAMDPTQDVIAFLENNEVSLGTIRIHIRAISNKEDHPCAHESCLQFILAPNPPDDVSINRGHLQISGNSLLLRCYSGRHGPFGGVSQPRILMWDWTSGDLVLDTFTSPNEILAQFDSFEMLDSTSFMTTLADDDGSINLFKFLQPCAADLRLVHLAILRLPSMVSGTRFSDDLKLYCGPIEANPLPGLPYVANKEYRLHLLKLEYLLETKKIAFDLFVHQWVLTKYLSDRTDGLVLDLPWMDWGPMNTRLSCPEPQFVQCQIR